jgi:hypothetical protein
MTCPDCKRETPYRELFCYGRCESCFADASEQVSPSVHATHRRVASLMTPKRDMRGSNNSGIDSRLVEPAEYLQLAAVAK